MDKVPKMLLNKFCLIWAAEDDNGSYLEEHTVIILKKIKIRKYAKYYLFMAKILSNAL